jgi:hypothetical protein
MGIDGDACGMTSWDAEGYVWPAEPENKGVATPSRLKQRIEESLTTGELFPSTATFIHAGGGSRTSGYLSLALNRANSISEKNRADNWHYHKTRNDGDYRRYNSPTRDDKWYGGAFAMVAWKTVASAFAEQPQYTILNWGAFASGKGMGKQIPANYDHVIGNFGTKLPSLASSVSHVM